MGTLDLIISYYKEDLGWLDRYKDVKFNKVYLYNKGPNKLPETKIPYIEIKLENIGRCDHTYLYHIISKYDELADNNIFTTGSVDLAHKSKKLDYILKKTLQTNNSVFEGSYYFNVRDSVYDFQMSHYESTYERNNTKENMAVSKIRPFGKWYDSHFKGINIHLINWSGIFSISRKHIQQHTKEYYKNLIDDFPNNSNPEVGHYFERAWLAVFNPIPNECIYYEYSLYPWNYVFLGIIILLLIVFILQYIEPIRIMAKKILSKGILQTK